MRFASRTLVRRAPRRLSALSLTVLLTACSGERAPAPADAASAPAAPLELTALDAPTREGSSEPHLSTAEDGILLSWWSRLEGDGHELRVAKLGAAGWSEPSVVTSGDDFFVNWADFPSVVEAAPGLLVAHWLHRGPEGGYDYGVRVARSRDGGETWSEPWTPHTDGTATEHGFVSSFPLASGGWGLVWLDGREFAAAERGEGRREMTLRYREVGPDGAPGDEVLVDGRICDCCQTDAVATEYGAIAVYRDRTEDEIRDIYVTRLVDGAWTEGVPVHDDGWHIEACPVNGPAVAARGSDVVVAWFTGAGDVPRVKASFSSDGGSTFGAPMIIDDGNPAGRVDVVLEPDGSARVVWLERLGGSNAEVRVKTARPDGHVGAATTVARSSAERPSGFPQMVRDADGSLVFAWTDVSASSSVVRMARATPGGSP